MLAKASSQCIETAFVLVLVVWCTTHFKIDHKLKCFHVESVQLHQCLLKESSLEFPAFVAYGSCIRCFVPRAAAMATGAPMNGHVKRAWKRIRIILLLSALTFGACPRFVVIFCIGITAPISCHPLVPNSCCLCPWQSFHPLCQRCVGAALSRLEVGSVCYIRSTDEAHLNIAMQFPPVSLKCSS